jgi:hypothetical protein
MAGILGYRTAVPEGTDLTEDRLYLESVIRKQSADTTVIADLLASSGERQLFEMSLRNKRISQEYVRLRTGAINFSEDVLGRHFDDFLTTKKRMEDHPAVKTLREELLCHRAVSSELK